MCRMNGSIASADLFIKASDKSVCDPDPRRSTRPGLGVSSASAISACLASVASSAERSVGGDPSSASQLVLRSHTLNPGSSSMSASQARRAPGVARLAKEEARQRSRGGPIRVNSRSIFTSS